MKHFCNSLGLFLYYLGTFLMTAWGILLIAVCLVRCSPMFPKIEPETFHKNVVSLGILSLAFVVCLVTSSFWLKLRDKL